MLNGIKINDPLKVDKYFGRMLYQYITSFEVDVFSNISKQVFQCIHLLKTFPATLENHKHENLFVKQKKAKGEPAVTVFIYLWFRDPPVDLTYKRKVKSNQQDNITKKKILLRRVLSF